MKLALIVAPLGSVVFACRTVFGIRHQKVVARDRECDGRVQAREEAGVDRSARGGIVFANRLGLEVRHEEGIARHCEGAGLAQPRDEARIDRGPRGGVVNTNRPGGLWREAERELERLSEVTQAEFRFFETTGI